MELKKNQSYVIFDGTCGFCNSSAKFIAKQDIKNQFILVSNSSDLGKELVIKYSLERISSSSIILVDAGRVSIRSEAVKKIINKIPGYGFLKFILTITPLFIQNFVYVIIAKFRKLIPIKSTCETLDLELRKKFKL